MDITVSDGVHIYKNCDLVLENVCGPMYNCYDSLVKVQKNIYKKVTKKYEIL